MFDFLGCFENYFVAIILGVRNFRVFEILEHLLYMILYIGPDKQNSSAQNCEFFLIHLFFYMFGYSKEPS